jgi:hypothetical protein
MKNLAVLTLVLMASISHAENLTENDKVIGERIGDYIVANKEPILQKCKEAFLHKLSILMMVKSFIKEDMIYKESEKSNQANKVCSQELLWYYTYCSDRVETLDGTISKGVGSDMAGCRSYSKRAEACQDANGAFRSAFSELAAWRQTYSESAKIRAAAFEDKFIKVAKQCVEGR